VLPEEACGEGASRIMSTRKRPIVYPCSDGQPMTDHDLNRALMEYVEQALAAHFAHDPLVYVSANHFIFYEEGNPHARIAPDVYLVRGVPKRVRANYLLWQEGVPPAVAFEFVSRRSLERDVHVKPAIYERIGIPEYYVFDPRGLLKDPLRLHAFRLVDGRYTEVPAATGIHSPALRLDLQVKDNWLWLSDPDTQRRLPTYEQERARADQASERVRQLEAELEHLRREIG
jgi:Uma2 family endonuclease